MYILIMMLGQIWEKSVIVELLFINSFIIQLTKIDKNTCFYVFFHFLVIKIFPYGIPKVDLLLLICVAITILYILYALQSVFLKCRYRTLLISSRKFVHIEHIYIYKSTNILEYQFHTSMH